MSGWKIDSSTSRKRLGQELAQNERAEVGIGTLIVFIAMILVAAIGAAVLIETSGMLQERAQSTGSQAVEQVGTNFEAVGVYGNRTGTTGNMEDVTLQMHLLPGARSLDLNQLTIRYTDGNSLRTLSYNATATGADTSAFNVTILRNVSSIFAQADPVIGQGDLVEIRIFAVDLGTRTNVDIQMNPESGSTAQVSFRTPNSYGDARYVQFR